MNQHFLHDARVVTVVNKEKSLNLISKEYPRIILFLPQPHQLIYLLHIALPLELLADKSGQELINLALEELQKANFPQNIQEVIALSSPERILKRPYYLHRAIVSTSPQPKWNIGRVVLAGDAAHGMPPFTAQGANQGLEDAAVIATLISSLNQHNNWDNLEAIKSVFQTYEDLRRPLINLVQNATLTRQPFSNQKQWQEYSQQVYGRTIKEMIPSFTTFSPK